MELIPDQIRMILCDSSSVSFFSLYDSVFNCVLKGEEEKLKQLVLRTVKEFSCDFQKEIEDLYNIDYVSAVNQIMELLQSLEKVASAFVLLDDYGFKKENIYEAFFKENYRKNYIIENVLNKHFSSYARQIVFNDKSRVNFEYNMSILSMLPSDFAEKSFYDPLNDAIFEFCQRSSLFFFEIYPVDSIIFFYGFAKRLLEYQIPLKEYLPEKKFCYIMELMKKFLYLENIYRLFEKKGEFVNYFFKDLRNYNFFLELIQSFPDEKLIFEKIFECFDYFIKIELDSVIKPEKNATSNPTYCKTICTTVQHLFNVLYILKDIVKNKDQPIRENIENMYSIILTYNNLQYEQCAALYISSIIEDLLRSNSEDKYRTICDIAQIISFSSNKIEFISLHSKQLLVRTCRNASQQYPIEKIVSGLLEPYIHESMTIFTKYDKEIQESNVILEAFHQKTHYIQFCVFSLNSVSSSEISQLNNIILPRSLQVWQNSFMDFFRTYKRNPRIQFKWIYEDNLVFIESIIQNVKHRMKTPLFFAVVFFYVFQNKAMKIREISEQSKLAVKDVITIVNSGMNKSIKLFNSDKKELSEDALISINPSFKGKNCTIMIPPTRFSLRINSSDSSNDKTETLKACVVKILKTKKQASFNEILNDARERLFSLFNVDSSLLLTVTNALQGTYISIDKDDPNLFIYQP